MLSRVRVRAPFAASESVEHVAGSEISKKTAQAQQGRRRRVPRVEKVKRAQKAKRVRKRERHHSQLWVVVLAVVS